MPDPRTRRTKILPSAAGKLPENLPVQALRGQIARANAEIRKAIKKDDKESLKEWMRVRSLYVAEYQDWLIDNPDHGRPQ